MSWSLDLRADSLIRKFLDLPGEFFSDGHVYGFRTDQRLVEDIVALELHAVPSLIACMGDDRQSKVTSHSPGTGADPYVLVVALCNELLHRTSFAEMKYDSLFELAAVDAGFGPREGGGASYEASAGVLRRDQRIWRAYLARYQHHFWRRRYRSTRFRTRGAGAQAGRDRRRCNVDSGALSVAEFNASGETVSATRVRALLYF